MREPAQSPGSWMVGVLVFAFSGFGEWKENPALEVSRELDGAEVSGRCVRVIETPVSTRFVREEVPAIILREEPELVLGVGLNPSKPNVNVERVAINVLSFRKPDVDGYRAEEEPIFPDGPAAYFSTIPVRRVVEELRRRLIPAEVSYFAGTYLCNALMYAVLHTLEKNGINAKGGFVHIPPTPDKVLKKPIPSMSKDMLVRALSTVIEVSLSNRATS